MINYECAYLMFCNVPIYTVKDAFLFSYYLKLMLSKQKTLYKCKGFNFLFSAYYPFKASAPPTISKISFVIAAWRALL